MERRTNSVELLESIIQSSHFVNELGEINRYAANVKQERHIVSLIAKLLQRQGLVPVLEKPNKKVLDKRAKFDLHFNGIDVEFKFYFDFDIKIMAGEDTIEYYFKEIKTNSKINHSWGVKYSLVKDVLINQPDVFVAIIQSREIKHLKDSELENICYGKDRDQRKFLVKPIEIYPVIDDFLIELKKKRSFNVKQIQHQFKSNFDSVYDFYICEF
jgi:hypothetical protein